jgi:flagellar motor protein MotB
MKWLVVASLAALTAGCAHEETKADYGRELENQDLTIRELTRRNNELVDRLRVLEAELETLRAENGALKRQAGALERIAELDAMVKRLQDELGRGGAADPEISVRESSEGVILEIADTVLFASGKAELTDHGRSVLLRVADRIRDLPNRIRVDGHTDTDPVVVHRQAYPLGNLELSGRRALHVAHFLGTDGGVEKGRISFQGCGEWRPVADNSTRDGKARNRRVEVLILRQ